MKKPQKSSNKRAQPLTLTTPSTASADAGFLVVGVGASAGGLEAYQALLKHLPGDTGLAFVLVQHLDPEHESALVRLLAKETSMPVHEVTNGLRVEPNCVYVIPPNTRMGIANGELKLSPRGKDSGPARSIDFFFEALAEDQHERAVGVVLSGTASDGTLGLEAIKAASGMTFAQDDSAKYDSMPRSAIAAGCVDFVLPPEGIAAELARIARHPFVSSATGEKDLPESQAEKERESNQSDSKDAPLASGGRGSPRTGSKEVELEKAGSAGRPDAEVANYKKILLTLRNHCGVDFTLYKSSTIQRRVMRRVILNKHNTLAEYGDFLKGDAKERDALYSDVLISVTSFFRNADAFEVLRRKIFPKLLVHRPPDEPVRFWVLGCSTGQEAYSLAMTYAESTDDAPNAPKLQIFATDLNEALLEKARAGFYAKSLAQDLPPERLRRFFVEVEGGYRVCKELREQVVFARQNVLSDPPFSRMDLITCRNLLIYLEPELQKKIMPAFHYALKPDGFLFLGSSESVGQFTDLFAPADKKQKIFSRKAARTPAFRLPLPAQRDAIRPQGPQEKPRGEASPETGLNGEINAQREADRIAVSQFCPPGVLVNGEGQVVQFRGATGSYLEPPRGKASFDLLKMAREGLMLPLRAALAKAKREHTPVQSEVIRVSETGVPSTVKLHVIPLRNLKEPFFLVCFEETGRNTREAPGPSPLPVGKRNEAKRIAALERELAETRDYLQSVHEQNEAANEELQASSEEVQSSNEELQSINEELETSQEELESANEELTTMNNEMASRNAELGLLNGDLNNLQLSLRTPILLLGRSLTIRRFTPPAEKIFNLLASDVGRPLGAIRHSLNAPDLESQLAEVVDSISVREGEVSDSAGQWYAWRAHPYLTLDNKIDGVVLILNDITALKRTEAELVASRNYAEATLRTLPVPFLVLQDDLRVAIASSAFCEAFHVTPAETQGKMIYELGNGQWNIPKLREALETILPKQNSFHGFAVEHDFESIGRHTMLLHARKLDSETGAPSRILLAIEDITERLLGEAILRQNEELFAAVIEQAPVGVYVVDARFRMQLVNSRALPTFSHVDPLIGRDLDEAMGILWPPARARELVGIFRHTLATGEAYLAPNFTELRKDIGMEQTFNWQLRRIILPNGEHGVVCYFSDITEQERDTETLRQSEERGRLLVSVVTDITWRANPEGAFIEPQPSWEAYTGQPWSAHQGCGWVKALHPDDRAQIKAAWDDARASAKVCVFEGRLWHEASRQWRYYKAKATPLLAADGTVSEWIGACTDVDDAHRAMEEIERVSRAKDDFLATLSHELRTPLTPVLMATAMHERDSSLSPELRESFAMISRNINLEARLIDDLLDLTRISRGKLQVELVTCDLHELLTQTAETLGLGEDGEHAQIVFDLTASRHHVLADPVRIQQVFWNILKNAFKFTPKRGTVTVCTSNDDGGNILVRVRDTGIGIPPAMIPHIFNAFEQGDVAGQPRYGGLGLGLAISKMIIEVHKGTIRAESDGAGRGATFFVGLAAVDPPKAPLIPPASVSSKGSSLCLLIVEDHEATRSLFEIVLKNFGHDVTTAATVREALAAFATRRFDAVISDLGLPDGSGIDLMREIQRQRPVPAVALSGYGMEEDIRQSMEAGFFAHLVKPINIDQLLNILEQIRGRL